MGKIKIVYIVNDLLLGGTQNILFNIVDSIDPSQFERKVWYLDSHKKGAESRPDFVAKFASIGVMPRCLGITSFIRGIFTLSQALKVEKPDIVHLALPDAVIIGTFAARLAGVNRVIIHEQNTHTFYTWKLNILFGFARMFSDLTITYSEILEEELFHTSHILSEPIQQIRSRSYTIYNAIRTDTVEAAIQSTDRGAKRKELGVADDEILIFSAARLIGWKGHEYLIRAFKEITHACPTAKLRIAGEGEDREKLQLLIVELGLEKSAELIGARTDVLELLVAADIYPQAYVYEKRFTSIPIGMSGMEALAFGLPVIVSNYPGLFHGLRDKENIIVVEPRDVAGLASALISLILHSDIRKEIGMSAKVFVDKYFSYDKTARIYESLYTALMK